ncbi:MAG: amidase family protein, partial [Desulfocapsaceae bacterium]
MEPYELTITEADTLLAEKKLSSVELTRSCLQRIEHTEETICSFISLDPDQALQTAEQADLRRERGEGGALCGIPLSIKDLLCTKDVTTTCGSKILENFKPPYDATVVEKLNDHG